VSTMQDLGHRAMSARQLAWRAGAGLLMAMGIGSVAVGLGGLIIEGGGLLFIPLGLPPLVAGYAALRRLRWSRPAGAMVALAYAGWWPTSP
jgi:predicted sugar kinase